MNVSAETSRQISGAPAVDPVGLKLLSVTNEAPTG
jgi:hypothetical protein